MLHTHSNEYKHHINNLKQVLKKYHDDTGITDLYLTQHCKKIILNKLTETQLFGCGFTKIYHLKNVNSYLHLQRIVLISNVTSSEFIQIEEIEHLFPKIYMFTLSTTVGEQVNMIKKAKFKQSIKQIREVNMNFNTYLDHVYYLTEMQKSSLLKSEEEKYQFLIFRKQPYKYERKPLEDRVGGYRSLLMSYPKIYEYEIHFVQSSNDASYEKLVSTLKQSLESSLLILNSHKDQCESYYDQKSSPRIKCLVLNREIINDFISPLIYGYFYGPLTEQCINRQKLIQGRGYLTSRGKMFNLLFQKDFNQAADYITSITKDKTLLQGQFQTNYFYKAKHIIASYEDPSPIQIALHISVWNQSKQYGLNRLKAAAIQQDLANRIDQNGRKVSNSKALNKVKNWMLESTQQQQKFITEEQLIKLSIIASLTANLWFFHHSTLKKLYDSSQNKSKFQNFLQRKQSLPTHKLSEKVQPQEQQRSQLYRHEPKVLKICQKWLRETIGIQNQNSQELGIQFKKESVNNDILRNRDSRLVIIIDGMVGYNQIAMLKKMIKALTDKQIAICAESLCNTQQYAEYLTRPVEVYKNNKK